MQENFDLSIFDSDNVKDVKNDVDFFIFLHSYLVFIMVQLKSSQYKAQLKDD